MGREPESLAAQEIAARVQHETLKGHGENSHQGQLPPLTQGWGTTTSFRPGRKPREHTARLAGTQATCS